MKAKQTILAGGVACGTLAILGGLFVPGIYSRGASAIADWTGGVENSPGVVDDTHNGRMYNEGTMDVQFTFNSSLSMVLSGDSVSIDSLTPGQKGTSVKTVEGQGEQSESALTITTTTNNGKGYTLSAKVGDATHTTTDLTSSAATNTAKIASIGSGTTLPDSGDDAKWGFSTDKCVTYKGFVNTTDGVELKTTATATATTGDAVTFDIGAYAPQGQPSGTYTNTITFTSVVNNPGD